jgi:ABC-type nitrate/sulfonate/bicarbonate transport system ATPase subunit
MREHVFAVQRMEKPRPPVTGTDEQAAPATVSVDIRRKAFRTRDGLKVVFSGLRFDVQPGEFVAILGPSGCGKTTLLRMIGGLDTDYDGAIAVNGRRVTGPYPEQGLMFQESRLLPWLKVWRNVAFALPSSMTSARRRTTAAETLRSVGLAGHENLWPSELSGGMAKRVALARAIVNVPSVLLLDEPFTALDSPTKYRLHDEIAHIHRRRPGMTTILVTHDVDEAVYLSDRILVVSPNAAHVLTEIPVEIGHPRKRTDEGFQDISAAVTRVIFERWWKETQEHRDISADI